MGRLFIGKCFATSIEHAARERSREKEIYMLRGWGRGGGLGGGSGSVEVVVALKAGLHESRRESE